jgi:integrase
MATRHGSIPLIHSQETPDQSGFQLCTMDTLLKGADPVTYNDDEYRPRYLDSTYVRRASGHEARRATISMKFSTAAERWISQHQAYIKPRTLHTYRQYVKTLLSFFSETPLGSIGIEQVRNYQRWRQESAGAIRTNSELSALQMILKEVDRWAPIARLYRPLPIPKTKVRRSLSPEQEARLLEEVLKAGPRAKLAGQCLIAMAFTSMGFGELRNLKRGDVFLNDDVPHITVNGGTKNDYRIRTIPLNPVALESMRWILKRWENLGGTELDQYILPHHATRTEEQRAGKGHQRRSLPNFSEPMGHIYRGARKILKAAGLEGYHPYDMRSHAITKLLSNPAVSSQVCQEIAGHVSQAMQRRYSRQLLDTKRAAMDTMCTATFQAQRETSRVIMFPRSSGTEDTIGFRPR